MLASYLHCDCNVHSVFHVFFATCELTPRFCTFLANALSSLQAITQRALAQHLLRNLIEPQLLEQRNFLRTFTAFGLAAANSQPRLRRLKFLCCTRCGLCHKHEHRNLASPVRQGRPSNGIVPIQGASAQSRSRRASWECYLPKPLCCMHAGCC